MKESMNIKVVVKMEETNMYLVFNSINDVVIDATQARDVKYLMASGVMASNNCHIHGESIKDLVDRKIILACFVSETDLFGVQTLASGETIAWIDPQVKLVPVARDTWGEENRPVAVVDGKILMAEDEKLLKNIGADHIYMINTKNIKRREANTEYNYFLEEVSLYFVDEACLLA